MGSTLPQNRGPLDQGQRRKSTDCDGGTHNLNGKNKEDPGQMRIICDK